MTTSAKRSFLASSLAFVLARGARAPANDLIDLAQLGERGVIFETSRSNDATSPYEAVGVGDTDGDGFGDLLVSVSEPPEAGGGAAVILIYGSGGLDGRHDLGTALPGSLRFRSRAMERPFADSSPAAADLRRPRSHTARGR